MTDRPDPPPFHRIGPDQPASPVLLSVPHAGRAYGEALLRSARVPAAVLEALEDRLVDRLVWRAVAAGATAIVAARPRAEIDLNRDEREVDPAMIAPPPPPESLVASARTRGGLGLVPARLAGAGTLWRGRLSRDELDQRIARVHRPYHAALAEALERTRRRFGIAILLDCHSMPPRTSTSPHGPRTAPAGLVFGDRHGTSIAPHLLAAAIDAARALGYRVACNDPYAGGYVVEHHGRPGRGIHALQLEIDRRLYLDAGLREPGPGFEAAARLIESVSTALADAALAAPEPLAAE